MFKVNIVKISEDDVFYLNTTIASQTLLRSNNLSSVTCHVDGRTTCLGIGHSSVVDCDKDDPCKLSDNHGSIFER